MSKSKWKFASVALVISAGVAVYFVAAHPSTSSSPTTSSRSTKASPSKLAKSTAQPTASTSAPSCVASQLTITVPTGEYYSPLSMSYGYSIGMTQQFHAKVIENTSGASCSVGGGVPKMERIEVVSSRSAALSSPSLPPPDGVSVNIQAQPSAGSVFTLAPGAKAEIWYLSTDAKQNPAATNFPAKGTSAYQRMISTPPVPCVEVFSIPTPSGAVVVGGPTEKCGGYQPLFITNYSYFFPLSRSVTPIAPKSDVPE